MKQHTTPEQTAKLIELGFENPKSYHDIEWDGTEAYGYQLDYAIGELMEILDKYQDKLSMVKTEYRWYVNYHTKNIELIDALYDMILNLKEEGVI